MQLELESPYLIKPVPGFTPTIGHLVSMMSFARQTTLEQVTGLSVSQLDYLMDSESNSIGMLLEHLACVEEWYQEHLFGREFGAAELERRTIGGALGARARSSIGNNALEEYLRRLAKVRQVTLAELAERDDDWLFEEGPWGGTVGNNYFKLFHVMEDELNHRGQMRIIRKRLPG